MPAKNYGLLNYTRSCNKPSSKACAKYIADMFDISNLRRVKKIVEKVSKETNKPVDKQYIKSIAEIVRAVFIEKQLVAHGRDRLCAEIDLARYPGTTLRQIAQAYFADNVHENGLLNTQGVQDRQDSARSYNPKMFKPARDIEQETNYDKGMNPDEYLDQQILDRIDDPFVDSELQSIEDKQEEEPLQWQSYASSGAVNKGDKVSGMAINKDIQGEHKNEDLRQDLTKILDSLLGSMEIRSLERGFNRPSRYSHFIKDCFLPVYKNNKQRKRPAFFIDASGSMRYSGNYTKWPCKTSAIGAFLRWHKRRISELRPKYYAFTSAPKAMQFDIDKTLPTASGGTNLSFLSSVKDNEISVVLTDAEFDFRDLALLRKWAFNHPKAEIHWITDSESQGDYIKAALKGIKSQFVHTTKGF